MCYNLAMDKKELDVAFKKVKHNLGSKLGVKTIQFNIWLYFFLFSLVIIGLLWIMQIAFSQSLYTSIIKKQTKVSSDRIFESYDPADLDNFSKVLATETYNNSMTILVFNSLGDVIYDSTNIYGSAADPSAVLRSKQIEAFLRRISESENAIVEYDESEFTPMTRYVYGRAKTIEDNLVFFYFTSPIQPYDITMSAFLRQLLIISSVLIVMGFVASWLISGKMGKPIALMSESANKFAKGDYTVKFLGNNYKEIDELADTLNYAVSEISKTDNLRKELIANVSHDLRTPLTMIKAYAEMARDLPSNKAKLDKNLNIIIEESDRLTMLVSDLLNLSRIQAGTESFMPARCDISKLTADILRRYGGFTKELGYTIVSDIEPNLYAVVDSSKISQAIYNLVGNAINYTGKDKTVFVNLSRHDNFIRFGVRDTGKGIPIAEIDNIWERYYRRNMHKRSVVGNGLGLSIVKGVLTMHNAQYGVDSVVGVGSCFWFDLIDDDAKPDKPIDEGDKKTDNKSNKKQKR